MKVCFFSRFHAQDLIVAIFFFKTAVDIISCVEFDPTGNYIAIGDRGGRVVILERVNSKVIIKTFLIATFN